jgi:hypothetical protein
MELLPIPGRLIALLILPPGDMLRPIEPAPFCPRPRDIDEPAAELPNVPPDPAPRPARPLVALEVPVRFAESCEADREFTPL